MADEIVSVMRVIQYVGKRSWVEDTVRRAIHGEMVTDQGKIIGVTLGAFCTPVMDTQDPWEILDHESMPL